MSGAESCQILINRSVTPVDSVICRYPVVRSSRQSQRYIGNIGAEGEDNRFGRRPFLTDDACAAADGGGGMGSVRAVCFAGAGRAAGSVISSVLQQTFLGCRTERRRIVAVFGNALFINAGLIICAFIGIFGTVFVNTFAVDAFLGRVVA